MSGPPPLPGALAEIEQIVGRESAIEVALTYGGQRIYIPREFDAASGSHPLCRLFAVDVASAIAARFSGCVISVPLARRHVALHLAGRGLSSAAIAGRLGVSQRTAQRYLAA